MIGYAQNLGEDIMNLKYKLADAQLKANITELTDCLARICQLRGVAFEWKGSAQTPEYGLVAQDLEQAFPEFVQRDGDGYRTVNYLGLFAANVQAIKELADMNAELVMQVSELRDELAALRSGNAEQAEITAETVMSVSDLIDQVNDLGTANTTGKKAA